MRLNRADLIWINLAFVAFNVSLAALLPFSWATPFNLLCAVYSAYVAIWIAAQ